MTLIRGKGETDSGFIPQIQAVRETFNQEARVKKRFKVIPRGK